MNKRVLAKEWIVFMASIAFGVFILPIFLILFLQNITPASAGYASMSMVTVYDTAFRGNDIYIVAIVPYIIVQLIRSAIWGAKNMKIEQP